MCRQPCAGEALRRPYIRSAGRGKRQTPVRLSARPQPTIPSRNFRGAFVR
jgi:hypothetical protein